jgi:Spy/CpxP family protein refolding chaperone
MQHVSGTMAGLALVLSVALVGGIQAQQQQEHQQHHPGGAQTPQSAPAETGAGAPAQPQQMQGMMERMQGMMERMQGMMGRGGMMGRQGMGMSAQGEEDDEEASPPRGMRGRRGMMGPDGTLGRHMERLAQQLQLTDPQQAQVRTLLRNHAKEAIRLRADIGVLAVDVRQLLDTDPVDLPKVKQLLQGMAMKEADLRLAHVTLMQEVNKLLTPEQHKQFRTMRERMMGMGGMMGRGHGER